MSTGFPTITPEQVKQVVDGLMGEIRVDPVDPILNPGMIIDNQKAVYDELVSNAYATDKFKNKLVFPGVVLWKIDTSAEFSFLTALRTLLPGAPGPGSTGAPFFLCYIPDLHGSMTNPLFFADKRTEYIRRILRFPFFEIGAIADETMKSAIENCQEGSVVNIRFNDSTRSLGYITELVTPGNWSEALRNTVGPGSAADAHGAGDATIPSDEVIPLSRQTTTEEFADLPPGSIIEGFDEESVFNVAQEEINAWSGLKETSEEAYPLLEKYWNNDPNNLEWTPSGTPWSAVFVSYIMNNSVGSFPNSASHAVYSRAVSEGNSGYSFIKISDLPKGAKVQANLGDILLYERDSQGASHGDVVYLTPNVKKARLVGGNLSDTVSTMELDLEGDAGYYASFGKYKFIIKHNAYVQYPQSENNS